MRTFWILAGLLVGGGVVIAMNWSSTFSVGAWYTAVFAGVGWTLARRERGKGGPQRHIDVALRDANGGLVAAECRRTNDAVKQEDVLAFAAKVEQLRGTLDVPVAGVFVTKRAHQIGAVKVADSYELRVAVLAEDAVPPSFTITFHRYDSDRERRIQDVIKHLHPASLALTGGVSTVVIRKIEPPQ